MKRSVFTLICWVFSLSLFAQDALSTARQFSDQHQYAQSAKLLDTFIGSHPERKYDVARAWWLQSYNLLQLGDQEAARKANSKSLVLRMDLRSSTVVENYLREAQISLKVADPNGALAAIQQGMNMLVEDPLIYAELNLAAAQAYSQLGDFEQTNSYYKIAKEVISIELGETAPAYAKLLYQGGLLLQFQQDYVGAFQAFSQAYRLLDNELARARSLVYASKAYTIMMAKEGIEKE